MRRKFLLSIITAVFFISGVFFVSVDYFKIYAAAEKTLSAGTAKINITPKGPIPMSGYPDRKDPSTGIHDPLFIRALVLDIDGYRVAIISCDLIKYCNKRVLDIAKKRFNISYLLICSSHTHSGPEFGEYSSPDYNSPYARSVEKAMIDGLDEALKNMFPARISSGYKSFPALGYNRLTNRGDAPAMWEDREKIPYGPVDPEVGVIKIEDKNGNTRVVLMQYACHAVTNYTNYDISADYPGPAAKKVEEAFGNNTICMFIQGGAGNINPMFQSPDRNGPNDETQTDYSQMEKVGSILADEVINLTKSLSPQLREKITLKAVCDSLKFTKRFDKKYIFNIHFTTILINDDIAIAAFPGEPMVWNQIFWKERAPVPHPFFFGYSYSSGGDFPGYVPDIRSAAYGGYGASDDYIIQIGAAEAIMNRHLENLYRLKGILKDEPLVRK